MVQATAGRKEDELYCAKHYILIGELLKFALHASALHAITTRSLLSLSDNILGFLQEHYQQCGKQVKRVQWKKKEQPQR